MTEKSIEIHYDTTGIPGRAALAFRNAATQHIESALMAQGLGDWAGAEIGAEEVNFGLIVPDFDQAETAIRQAVAGIRNITRHEASFDDLLTDTAIRPLGMLELLGVLIF